MSLKRDMVAYLKTEAGMAAVMDAGGLHPGIAPQRKKGAAQPLPYITWTRLEDAAEHAKTERMPLSRAVFQFDCWAATAKSLDATAEALGNALDGFRGFWGSTDARHVRVDSESDGLEYPIDGRERPIHRSIFTVTIWYARTVPVR